MYHLKKAKWKAKKKIQKLKVKNLNKIFKSKKKPRYNNSIDLNLDF